MNQITVLCNVKPLKYVPTFRRNLFLSSWEITMMLERLVHIYKQHSATFQKAVIFRKPKISQINADFKIHFNIILQPTSATAVDVHSELVYKTSWSCFAFYTHSKIFLWLVPKRISSVDFTSVRISWTQLLVLTAFMCMQQPRSSLSEYHNDSTCNHDQRGKVPVAVNAVKITRDLLANIPFRCVCPNVGNPMNEFHLQPTGYFIPILQSRIAEIEQWCLH
jgi:hypothetical protein